MLNFHFSLNTPKIVPNNLDATINYGILFLIVLFAVIFQFVLTFVFDSDDQYIIISIISFTNPLIAAVVAFVIAHRYKNSHVFGRSYLLLSLSFFSVFLGEIIYLIYDLVLKVEPYPSIADVFFFAYSPFLTAHLIFNIRFFQSSIKLITKLWISAIPVTIVVFYVLFSLYEIDEINFDFYYGTVFVLATSITLTFTILGTKIFKKGVLGKSWLILLFGILALTFADDWYYYLETFGGYDLTHPVNILWYAGYWIVVYALIKHKEII